MRLHARSTQEAAATSCSRERREGRRTIRERLATGRKRRRWVFSDGAACTLKWPPPARRSNNTVKVASSSLQNRAGDPRGRISPAIRSAAIPASLRSANRARNASPWLTLNRCARPKELANCSLSQSIHGIRATAGAPPFSVTLKLGSWSKVSGFFWCRPPGTMATRAHVLHAVRVRPGSPCAGLLRGRC